MAVHPGRDRFDLRSTRHMIAVRIVVAPLGVRHPFDDIALGNEFLEHARTHPTFLPRLEQGSAENMRGAHPRTKIRNVVPSSDHKEPSMRSILRTAFVTAAAVPLAVAVPGLAAAADASEVTYAFGVDGHSVTNTVTNNTGGILTCATSLAPAPGGVLPPVSEVLYGTQLGTSSDIRPGATVHTVIDVPDGSYVALASCVNADATAMWVSDYPGIEETLALFPYESFTVEQAATVVTVPAELPALPSPGNEPVPNPLFGSSN